MSKLVVDANTVIDWFHTSEEGEAYSRYLEPLITEGGTQLVVPLHFDIEVCAHLVKKNRQQPNVFSDAWLATSLNVLDALPFEIAAIGTNFNLLGNLAKAFNPSVYDTPYLHLARTMELPLATRDPGLISACKRWNVLHWTP